MILSTHGIIGSSVTVASGDADALAFFTAAGITDTTQKSAVNTLVTDLKAANIWTKIKALYPFVGGTAAQHRFNLKSPGTTNTDFYLTFIGGWTHSSTGALPNGTTGYADTFLTPSTSLSLNSTHISYYSRTNSSGINFAIGSGYNTFASDLQIAPRWVDNNTYYRVNSTSGSGENTGADSRGLFIANRISNSETRNYRNSTRYVLSLASNSLNTNSLYISSTNVSNTPTTYNDREVSLSSIGDGLSDTEALNFYNAVQAFQITLGRQF